MMRYWMRLASEQPSANRWSGALTVLIPKGKIRSGILLSSLALAASFTCPEVAAQGSEPRGCAKAPTSALVVDVKKKGARGDGRTEDTAAIQAAIDEVAGTGGTVLVPSGTYMIDAVGKKRLALRSGMTLRLSSDATLKAIANGARKYAVLSISGVSDVTVVGGTLEGEREAHRGKSGEAGMGIRIDRGAKHITISGVTAKKMWGDGFYVRGAKEVKFCAITADNNRRQGLSIVDADGVLVTHSIFKNTQGTRPSAGIDLEPNDAQTVKNIRIQNSKFIDNAGSGIQIAGKRGRVSKVEISRNAFRGNRPLLVEDAPAVLAWRICDNRQVTPQPEPSRGAYAFADTVEVVVHQNDCQDGRDLRFEVNRQRKHRKRAE